MLIHKLHKLRLSVSFPYVIAKHLIKSLLLNGQDKIGVSIIHASVLTTSGLLAVCLFLGIGSSAAYFYKKYAVTSHLF